MIDLSLTCIYRTLVFIVYFSLFPLVVVVSSRAINEENARYRAQLEEKDELIELLKQQVGSLTRTVVDMEKQNKSLTSQTEVRLQMDTYFFTEYYA